MEIGGQKIALGVPTPKGKDGAQSGPTAYPLIPLGRGASPDEAASSILLCVGQAPMGARR
jgi:3-oxoacyl-[acyl-carrier protein] reductase